MALVKRQLLTRQIRPLVYWTVCSLALICSPLQLGSVPAAYAAALTEVGSVNPETGLLPFHGDGSLAFLTPDNEGIIFQTYEFCPPGSYLSNLTIGLSSLADVQAGKILPGSPASKIDLMVTGVSGGCSSSRAPNTYVRRLWGYGYAWAQVQNVSLTPTQANSVSGTEFNGTDSGQGGVGALFQTGGKVAGAVSWQDQCPPGSSINGYAVFLYAPGIVGSALTATPLFMGFSCSGVEPVSTSSVEGPRPDWPVFTAFLPIDVNTTRTPVYTNVTQGWLPWRGANFSGLANATTGNQDDFPYLLTQLCPSGSYLSTLGLGFAPDNVIISVNANCSSYQTQTFVTFLLGLGEPNLAASRKLLRLSPLTQVNGTTLDEATDGELGLGSLLGWGATKLGVAWADTCPPGTFLDGFQGLGDSGDTNLLSIRFHCSAMTTGLAPQSTPVLPSANSPDSGVALPPVSPFSGLTPPVVAPRPSAASPAGVPSASAAEAQIVAQINQLRSQNGVPSLSTRNYETCVAQSLEMGRGGVCTSADSANAIKASFSTCLGSAPAPASVSELVYCKGPAQPSVIVNTWSSSSFEPSALILNASFAYVGISQIATSTTMILSTANTVAPASTTAPPTARPTAPNTQHCGPCGCGVTCGAVCTSTAYGSFCFNPCGCNCNGC